MDGDSECRSDEPDTRNKIEIAIESWELHLDSEYENHEKSLLRSWVRGMSLGSKSVMMLKGSNAKWELKRRWRKGEATSADMALLAKLTVLRQEATARIQLRILEDEKKAALQKEDREKQAALRRQQLEDQAEAEAKKRTEREAQEHERYLLLKTQSEKQRQADLDKQAGFKNAFSYDDVSNSPLRFRLLKLYAKGSRPAIWSESPPTRPPGPASRPRYPRSSERRSQLPSAYGQSKRHEYDMMLFELQTKYYEEDRLLHMQFKDSLFCSMQTFDLDSPDCPSFEALSYEWNANKEKGKRRIVLSHGSSVLGSIEIGYNLFDLLSHIQPDEEGAYCWVWADAVSINQDSDEEKGHQVRMMGEIYKRAEKVSAWLPLENPRFCVDALERVQRMIRDSKPHSIAKTNKRYLPLTSTDWLNLDYVFKSGYWTRKWIIQEIVLARTVVLVLGNSVFAMQELENIFAGLDLMQEDPQSPGPSTAALRELPIARLAAHRRNRRQETTYPRMLHEMLPMYAENQCSDYLDHVYALYNLIGDHRKHLEIGYGQRALTWFEQILKFIDCYEHASRKNMLSHALLLIRLSKEHEPHELPDPVYKSDVHVTTMTFERGTLTTLEECAHSISLRKHVKSLHHGIKWILRHSDDCWHIDQKAQGDTLGLVNKRVLGYFKLEHYHSSSSKDLPSTSHMYGLAAARIQDGDRVWQFPDMELALIVRLDQGDNSSTEKIARVVGRCYLFECHDDNTDLERKPPNAKLMPGLEEGLPSYDLRLNLEDLYTLANCVTDCYYPRISEATSRMSMYLQTDPARLLEGPKNVVNSLTSESVVSLAETLYSPTRSSISLRRNMNMLPLRSRR